MLSQFDVEQIVKRIVGTLQAPIAALKDGTIQSDGHRVLNFQGPGVTVSDDAGGRRVNVFIPGALTSSSATNVVSTTSAKAFTLWSGSANNAPPANWQTVGFSDAGWSAAVAATVGGGTPTSGATAIWSSAAPLSTTEATLIRQTFTLPAGTISGATLTVDSDAHRQGIWINGTLLAGSTNTTIPSPTLTFTISPSLLVAGGSNVIALEAQNFGGTPDYAWVTYKLAVTYAAAAADPQYIPKSIIAAKGDLIAGASAATPAAVAVGTNGQVLTADSTATDGVSWQTPAGGGMSNPMTTQDDIIIGGTAGAATRLAKGTDSQVLTVDPVSHHLVWDTPGVTGVAYINIQDQKTSGTGGGTFTSGSFQTRTLNTVVSDLSSIASLASNQITLPAGTYRFRIKCPAQFVNSHQARLQNITDSTTVQVGSGEFAGNGSGTSAHTTSSFVTGKFTIAASKAFEVQHRCSATNGSNGFGSAMGWGTEVYTVAEFWKEA